MADALPSARPSDPRPRPGLQFGSVGFAVMITVLLVAIVFAANQNSVIGWLVVAVAGGWLIFAIVAFAMMRRGLRSVGRRMDTMVANTAVRQQPVDAAPAPSAAADPMRETKLDHSFKICQVQVRVVEGELAKGEQMDRDVVARALETIQITSSNARDMIKAEGGPGGTEGPVSGTVIG